MGPNVKTWDEDYYGAAPDDEEQEVERDADWERKLEIENED